MAQKEPRKAHMVRVYDEALWVRLRHRGVEEGRTVGLIVENALRVYLATPAVPNTGVERSKPTVEDLRALVETVKPESARERAQRMAERQAYLREHPEEEPQ